MARKAEWVQKWKEQRWGAFFHPPPSQAEWGACRGWAGKKCLSGAQQSMLKDDRSMQAGAHDGLGIFEVHMQVKQVDADPFHVSAFTLQKLMPTTWFSIAREVFIFILRISFFQPSAPLFRIVGWPTTYLVCSNTLSSLTVAAGPSHR
jgi:hypothetical protein